MKFDVKELLNVSLWIFIVTVISGGIAIIYQQTYLHNFGVDYNVLNLEVDPSYIFKSAGMMFAIGISLILMYFTLNLIFKFPKFYHSHPIRGNILTDIASVLMIGLVIVAVQNKEEAALPGVGAEVTYWFALVMGIILATGLFIKFIYFVFIKLSNRVSFKSAYIDMSNTFNPIRGTKITSSPKNFLIPVWIPLTIIAFYFFNYIPVAIANKEYERTKTFTEIVKPDKSEETVRLVISRSGSNLIVKDYNVNKKQFLDEFQVMKNENLKFKSYTTN